jgi:hypothetical protein
MIDSHDFSSQWFGSPVGIVRDAAFFALPAAERRAALGRYSWVEYRAPSVDGAVLAALMQDGFLQSDVQIHFRLRIAAPEPGPSLDTLSVVRADEKPFSIAPGEMADFTHERFSLVPGVTTRMITQRYEMWAVGILKSAPHFCLEVRSERGVEGWFLSSKDAKHAGLNLALAVLHRDAGISGMLLYRKALGVYRSMGETLGWASFSATNTPVLNIYSELGARFTSSTVIWLWINPSPAGG